MLVSKSTEVVVGVVDVVDTTLRDDIELEEDLSLDDLSLLGAAADPITLKEKIRRMANKTNLNDRHELVEFLNNE